MDNGKEMWKTAIYNGETYDRFEISNTGKLRNAKTKHIYKLTINKDFCSNINIYDIDEIKILIPNLLKKYIKKLNLTGILYLDIYLDNNYGMIIEIENKKFNFKNNILELKINFHLNNLFLYKIDLYKIKEILN